MGGTWTIISILIVLGSTAAAQAEWRAGEVLCAYEVARATQILGRYCDNDRLPFDDENDEAVAILTDYIIANSGNGDPVLDRYYNYEKRVSFMSETERAALCNDPTNAWLIEERAAAELGRILPVARRITATPATPTYGDCF